MDDKEKIDNLNQVVQRLIDENGQMRQKVEEVEVILRHRASNAAGLSFAASIKTILNDRDEAQDRIQFFRDELKKICEMIVSGQAKDVARRITHFLFNNPR